MLGTKVFLELYVKAEPGWRDSRRFVEELDWRRQLEHRMLKNSTQEEAEPTIRSIGEKRNETKA
jgi:GTP-binding protein Era